MKLSRPFLFVLSFVLCSLGYASEISVAAGAGAVFYRSADFKEQAAVYRLAGEKSLNDWLALEIAYTHFATASGPVNRGSPILPDHLRIDAEALTAGPIATCPLSPSLSLFAKLDYMHSWTTRRFSGGTVVTPAFPRSATVSDDSFVPGLGVSVRWAKQGQVRLAYEHAKLSETKARTIIATVGWLF